MAKAPVTLFCATTNPGKLVEFEKIVAHFSHGRLRVASIPGLKAIEAPEETGDTFAANAILKAEYYSRFTQDFVFCDDSGLEVDALAGAPGIYSARFAGPHATDPENNALLLSRLAGVENRRAQYVCAIALAQAGQTLQVETATVEGRIQDQAAGTHGFGYDPYFFYPPFNRTLAQALPEEKLLISHRGKALAKILDFVLAQLGPSQFDR